MFVGPGDLKMPGREDVRSIASHVVRTHIILPVPVSSSYFTLNATKVLAANALVRLATFKCEEFQVLHSQMKSSRQLAANPR